MINDIAVFQVLTVLFSVAMIARVISQYRRGRRTKREIAAWFVVWGAVALVAIYPAMTDRIAHLLGLKSGANTLIYFLLVVLIYVALRSVFMIEELQGRISELTRRIAIKDFENERSSDRPR